MQGQQLDGKTGARMRKWMSCVFGHLESDTGYANFCFADDKEKAPTDNHANKMILNHRAKIQGHQI
jgi:hypothetical protein